MLYRIEGFEKWHQSINDAHHRDVKESDALKGKKNQFAAYLFGLQSVHDLLDNLYDQVTHTETDNIQKENVIANRVESFFALWLYEKICENDSSVESEKDNYLAYHPYHGDAKKLIEEFIEQEQKKIDENLYDDKLFKIDEPKAKAGRCIMM